jgi:hypothetical protein
MKTKDIIVWVAAIIAFLTGIGLCIAGFYVPPTGEIDGSVLTATGEFLTFFGSVFGIGKYTEMQLEKIKRKTDEV